MRTTVIDQDVREVLNSIEWDGSLAKITCGQLDRKLYVKVNDVLIAAGGTWSKKAKAHEFGINSDAQACLESMIETGEFVRTIDRKQQFGFFETPDDLADLLVERADVQPTHQILEPSAGTGQLVKAALRGCPDLPGNSIWAIDIQPENVDLLKKLVPASCQDFLSLVPGLQFDRVLMNPPFAKQADIDHVLHAFEFLKVGGRLVSIMSVGWTFRTNVKSRSFQAFVDRYGEFFPLPDDAFKASGTMVKTVMVVLNK